MSAVAPSVPGSSGPDGVGEPVLAVDGLTVRHGGLVALDDVTLTVAAGSITGLIGPNGAGKTTFIDTITGFTRGHHGRILFAGRPIDGIGPHVRSRRGLVRTFQSLELFDDLTVRQNLAVASAPPDLRSTLTDALWPKAHDQSVADEVLADLDLAGLAERSPDELSNGQRHMVALARALVARPRLVLLDEPAAGLDPTETDALAEVLRALPARGVSVLLVDHDMALVMGVCDTVHVLDFGRLVASGPPAVVRADPVVVAAYLGRDSGSPEARTEVADVPVEAPTDATAEEPTEPPAVPAPVAPHPPTAGTSAAAPLLEVRGLTAGYGDITVVRDLDLTVRPGEVVALLGANGAGKTTTLLAISGLVARTAGSVEVLGRGIPVRRRVRPADVWRQAGRGVAHVPEDRGLFFELTAAENLRLGRVRGRPSLPIDAVVDRLPALGRVLDRKAGLLSGGEQQMLALARAMISRPSLLLVDEMSLGLAPLVVEHLLPILRDVADDPEHPTGVLVVEQHVSLVLSIADRGHLLSQGRIVHSGTAAELRDDAAAIEASYLGAAST